MNYSAITIEISNATEEKVEVLVAILDSLSFEGITEHATSVTAYIPTTLYDKNLLEVSLAGVNTSLHAKVIKEELVEEKNWNEEWEKNFDPVIVDHKCVVRAPFHEDFNTYEHVITISPKMSFGTGHHETTSLMISELLKLDVVGKKVLDMGCGTGVLGILAKILGAEEVVGIDNDRWAYENAIENTKINNVEMKVLQGSVEAVPGDNYDVVLANINRNILIEQASDYYRVLNQVGRLFLSGILAEDVEMVEATFVDLGFTPINHESLAKWQMLEFVK